MILKDFESYTELNDNGFATLIKNSRNTGSSSYRLVILIRL